MTNKIWTNQLRGRGRRSLGKAFSILVLAALGVLTLALPAAASIPATSGSLTMQSEPGDYIGGGMSYSYSTGAQDTFETQASGSQVQISVRGISDWWYLHFAAPEGEQLVAGSYPGATRWPFQSPGEPGLDVSGNGRGCNTLTGSFNVIEATYGPNNYLHRFHATFEQHCEGAEPALRGEVFVENPPAPEPLSLQATMDPSGNVNRQSGVATVSGTVTCNEPVSVTISGSLSQRAGRFKVASGSFTTQVSCSSTPATWTASVAPASGVPFNQGKAEVQMTASAFDPAYGRYVTVQQTGTVTLTK